MTEGHRAFITIAPTCGEPMIFFQNLFTLISSSFKLILFLCFIFSLDCLCFSSKCNDDKKHTHKKTSVSLSEDHKTSLQILRTSESVCKSAIWFFLCPYSFSCCTAIVSFLNRTFPFCLYC